MQESENFEKPLILNIMHQMQILYKQNLISANTTVIISAKNVAKYEYLTGKLDISYGNELYKLKQKLFKLRWPPINHHLIIIL